MLENGRISGAELTCLMISFILGSATLLPPGVAAEHQAWQAVIAGMAEAAVFMWIFTAMAKRFPRMTAVGIFETVFGRWVGKAVAAGYLFYLFHLGSLVVRISLDFIKFAILEQAPLGVILVVGLIVCGYAAISGVEVMGRCSQALVILITVMFFTIAGLLVPQIHRQHFFPLFVVPISKFMAAAQGAAAFPFGETVAFMMLFPFLKPRKDIRKSSFTALLFGGLLLVGASARNVGVLGNTLKVTVYSNYYVARLIDIGEVFTRLEIVVAINFLTMVFLKVSVLLYGSALGMAQLFGLSKYQPLVVPLGVAMFILALFNFANVIETFEFAQKVYPIYAPLFSFGIPCLTLIVARLRHLPGQGGGG